METQNLSNDAIEELRIEAGIAGDDEQIELCLQALLGDGSARLECENAINQARDMQDD